MKNKLLPRDKWISLWRNKASFILQKHYWAARACFAETILKICFTEKKKNRAEHIRGLETKIKNQAEQITGMQDQLVYNDQKMKALNILVACDGPCNRSYMNDPYSVDANTVKIIKRNYERFMHWWDRGGQQAADLYLNRYKKDIQ